jgi:hypothetical protein
MKQKGESKRDSVAVGICGKILTFGFSHKSKLRRNPNFLRES